MDIRKKIKKLIIFHILNEKFGILGNIDLSKSSELKQIIFTIFSVNNFLNHLSNLILYKSNSSIIFNSNFINISANSFINFNSSKKSYQYL